MLFKPRKVPRTRVRSWFVEALDLSRRNVLAFVVLGIIVIGVDSLDVSGLVVLCTFPLVLALGCVIAKSADNTEPVLKTLAQLSPRSISRVFIVGATPWIMLSIMSLFTTGAAPGETISYIEPTGHSASLMEILIGFSLMIALVTSVISILFWITSFLWFFWTLLIAGELPVLQAIEHSVEGTELNRFVAWPYGASVLLLVCLVFLAPLLLLPWLAITTSMMYVSYRDIWLGKNQNKPVRVRSTVVVKGIAT